MKKIRTPVAERTWKEKLDVTILEQLWKIRTRRPGTRHIDEVLELFVCWCFFNLSGIISFVDWVGACVSVQGGSGVGRESTCQFLEWFWWFFRCKFPVCNFSLTVRVLKRLSPDSFYHLFSGRFQWQGTSKNCMILMLNTKENSTHIEEIENKLPRYPPRLVILMCFVAHQQEMPVVFQWFRPHHEKKKRFLRAKTNPRPNLLILASILTCSQTVDFAPSQKEHDQILRKEPIERCTRHECHLAVLLFGWKCSAQTKRLQGWNFRFPWCPQQELRTRFQTTFRTYFRTCVSKQLWELWGNSRFKHGTKNKSSRKTTSSAWRSVGFLPSSQHIATLFDVPGEVLRVKSDASRTKVHIYPIASVAVAVSRDAWMSLRFKQSKLDISFQVTVCSQSFEAEIVSCSSTVSMTTSTASDTASSDDETSAQSNMRYPFLETAYHYNIDGFLVMYMCHRCKTALSQSCHFVVFVNAVALAFTDRFINYCDGNLALERDQQAACSRRRHHMCWPMPQENWDACYWQESCGSARRASADARLVTCLRACTVRVSSQTVVCRMTCFPDTSIRFSHFTVRRKT